MRMNFWVAFNDESIKLENLPEYIHEKDEPKVETFSEIVRLLNMAVHACNSSSQKLSVRYY